MSDGGVETGGRTGGMGDWMRDEWGFFFLKPGAYGWSALAMVFSWRHFRSFLSRGTRNWSCIDTLEQLG